MCVCLSASVPARPALNLSVKLTRRSPLSTAVTVTGAAADVAAARAEIEKIIGFAASDRPLRVAALAVSSNDHGKVCGARAREIRTV